MYSPEELGSCLYRTTANQCFCVGRSRLNSAAAISNLDRVLGTFGFSPDGSSMVALVDVVDQSANRAMARGNSKRGEFEPRGEIAMIFSVGAILGAMVGLPRKHHSPRVAESNARL